jgi:hypothetical protein
MRRRHRERASRSCRENHGPADACDAGVHRLRTHGRNDGRNLAELDVNDPADGDGLESQTPTAHALVGSAGGTP